MIPVVTIHRRVRRFSIDLPRLTRAVNAAVPHVLRHLKGSEPPLANLPEIEASIVSDTAIAKVHAQFMDDPTATDVITFHHGEIVIGAEVAERQAAEYDEPLAREILRYMVHGLLHLAGHEDAEPGARTTMETAQETIVAHLWTPEFRERLNC